jgi:inosine-uridine nucleoside N-ribohydrolase
MNTQVERPSIILDCDPGHDDAAAIVVAARYTNLLAITTVGGNAPLAQTTHNALLMAQLFDINCPIAAGEADPLDGVAEHAPSIHGLSGLDGPVQPPVTRTTIDMHAVDLIIETVEAHPGLWIVATGPSTNVARALQRKPSLVDDIAGISLMGGSATFGNWSAAAEFNILLDPEAADIVFRCGAPIRMLGLNATHQVLVEQRHVDRLHHVGTERALFMAGLYEFFRSSYLDAFNMANAPLHDPCAVMAVSHPHLFDLRPRHVVVELIGTHTRGMTLVDQRGEGLGQPANTEVAYDPNAEAVLDLVHAAVLNLAN